MQEILWGFEVGAGEKFLAKIASKITDVKESVERQDFYERDDISRCTTGKKETKTKEKVKKQKRMLNDSMKNLHVKFHFLAEIKKVKYRIRYF